MSLSPANTPYIIKKIAKIASPRLKRFITASANEKARTTSSSCEDCQGTGQYVGLHHTESCGTCAGTGQLA